MSTDKTIEHEGVIVSITPDMYRVKIQSRSACSSCHAKGFCSASDSKQKEIDVLRQDSDPQFSVGESVSLRLKQSLGMKAVWIVYLPPILILVTILLYLQHLNVSELYIGLFVILGIGLYYLVLYLFKDRIAKDFYFSIRKLNKDN